MTDGRAGANSAADDENAGVLVTESLSPRRRRRQVRELVDALDVDELQELAAYLEDRLRGIIGASSAADADDVGVPQREAA